MATTLGLEYLDDYSDDVYVNDLCHGGEIWFFSGSFPPVVYSLAFLLALVGNVLVLSKVCCCRQAHSLTDTFILHLTASNLLLTFTLPFFIKQLTDLKLVGPLSCQMVGAAFSLNAYCGALFLACMSFDQYLAIVHMCDWLRNGWRAHMACVVIWGMSLGLAVVDVHFHEVINVEGRHGCKMQFDQESSKQTQGGQQVRNLVLAFVLPLLVMLYCYARIFHKLCHATPQQRHKSLWLIVSLVVAFVISWAPYVGLRFFDSLMIIHIMSPDCKVSRAIDVDMVFAESMGLAHCVLNPLIIYFSINIPSCCGCRCLVSRRNMAASSSSTEIKMMRED